MLRYLKLAERHFARTAARASLGLPPLEPPNEFLCPVTQAGQHAQKKRTHPANQVTQSRSKAPASDLESALPA
jgi:hypothetical protein